MPFANRVKRDKRLKKEIRDCVQMLMKCASVCLLIGKEGGVGRNGMKKQVQGGKHEKNKGWTGYIRNWICGAGILIYLLPYCSFNFPIKASDSLYSIVISRLRSRIIYACMCICNAETVLLNYWLRPEQGAGSCVCVCVFVWFHGMPNYVCVTVYSPWHESAVYPYLGLGNGIWDSINLAAPQVQL